MKQSRPSRPSRRVGVAYLLTMLYLMLFSVLAIGFAAASAMSVQVADNDRRVADAQAAAESGLELVRFHLSQLVLPNDCSDANLLASVADGLGRELDDSPDMKGQIVSAVGNAINLPAANDSFALDPNLGTTFHAQITIKGHEVSARIIGHDRSGAMSRAVQLDFRQRPHIVNGATDGIRLFPVPGTYEEVSP